MADLELTHHNHIDLECGGSDNTHHLRRSSGGDSQCFSDADEGSCYSQFYSSYGDPEIGQVSDTSRRVSSAASDCSVDIAGDENHEGKVAVVHLGKKLERICRICHLNLADDDDDNDNDNEDAIELGCCCKDDLAAAHRHCAETWFKIKGNKTCEICNSIVTNLVGPNETSSTHRTTDTNLVATDAAAAYASITTQSRRCINGHRLLNFILACMVFAFVISWLFHFNIPS